MSSIYELKKPKSLLPIKELIEKSGIPLSEIAIFFDFDQTLTQKDGFKATLRGGNESAEFLAYLNSSDIKWYVNTAAGSGPSSTGAIATSMKNYKIPFSNHPINGNICLSEKERVGFLGVTDKTGGINIGYCNNIVSAGYNKAEAIDFVLGTIEPNGPIKLIIFVDDNAKNVENVYKHFNGKKTIIGIIYEPYKIAEPDHEHGMKELGENPGIQQLGGRRHTRHKQSHRSKRFHLRKSTRRRKPKQSSRHSK